MQVCPSPVNPGLQMHRKPSGWSTHVALMLQGVAPIVHSLISVNNGKKQNSDMHAHSILGLCWLVSDLPAVMAKLEEDVSGEPRNGDVIVIWQTYTPESDSSKDVKGRETVAS